MDLKAKHEIEIKEEQVMVMEEVLAVGEHLAELLLELLARYRLSRRLARLLRRVAPKSIGPRSCSRTRCPSTRANNGTASRADTRGNARSATT